MTAERAPGGPTGWQRVVLRVAHIVEPQDEPAEAIFGTLVAAAVLATKGQAGGSGQEIFWSALAVLFVYWLAHVYADVVGERLHTRTRPGWSGIVKAALRDWSMLRGSLLPVAIFGLVRLLGASVNAAVLTALWSTIFLLAMWGLVAALRGGARGVELLLETLVCGALGVLTLALKTFVH